jgi:hypothetical protein
MELSKDSYERAGLQGVPMSFSGGRKHVKLRYRKAFFLRVNMSTGFLRLKLSATFVSASAAYTLCADFWWQLWRSTFAFPQCCMGSRDLIAWCGLRSVL